MNSIAGNYRAGLLAFALLAGSAVSMMPAMLAAQTELTVEELEKYIAEQKAALEAVKANRDETERKAQQVRDTLAEQEARQSMVEEELDALCKEQEELKPGSYDECRKAWEK